MIGLYSFPPFLGSGIGWHLAFSLGGLDFILLGNKLFYTEVSSIRSTDDAVSELADFRAWFDHLSSKCSDANVCVTSSRRKCLLKLPSVFL